MSDNPQRDEDYRLNLIVACILGVMTLIGMTVAEVSKNLRPPAQTTPGDTTP